MERLLGVSFAFNEALIDNEKHVVVSSHMEEFLEECIKRYEAVKGAPGLRKATSPFHDIAPAEFCKPENKVAGLFSSSCASLVMSLAYAARLVRPDILVAINSLSTQLTKWSILSDACLVKLFSYVRSTIGLRMYGCIKVGTTIDWFLHGFADANLGGSDTHTRSTSGAILFITNAKTTRASLTWTSAGQCATATSTAEAELVSLTKYSQQSLLPQEILWQGLLSREIESVSEEDNSAALSIVASGFSTALRYLQKTQRLSVGFCHEVYKDPLRVLRHCITSRQRADGLTKMMAANKLILVLAQFGLANSWDELDKDVFFGFP